MTGDSVKMARCLLAALLCVVLVCGAVRTEEATRGSGPQQAGAHPGFHGGSTVCIEIHPGQNNGPTKVCGPMVSPQGLPQQQQPLEQTAPRAAGPFGPSIQDMPQMITNMIDEPHQQPKEVEAPPCDRAPLMPRYPGPMFLPRMDMAEMSGMLMPVDMDNAWRQAPGPSPPCSQGGMYRSAPGIPPMPIFRQPIPMMPIPLHAPALIAQPNMPSLHHFRSNDESTSNTNTDVNKNVKTMSAKAATNSNEAPANKLQPSLEALLKECEEKTKVIQEKERMIAELQKKMKEEAKSTVEAEPHNTTSVKK